MALDEATATFLVEMAQSGIKPLHEMTPDEARGLGGLLRDLYGPGPDVATVSDESLPVEGGEIALRVLVPEGEPRAVIVYYHGGGWVIGAPDEFDTRSGTGLGLRPVHPADARPSDVPRVCPQIGRVQRIRGGGGSTGCRHHGRSRATDGGPPRGLLRAADPPRGDRAPAP